VAASPELGDKLAEIQMTTGAVLAPFDSWLVLRGLKTLALRLRRQEESALELSSWLASRKEVSELYYAGAPGHPQRALSLSQATGFGSMISFRLRDPGLVGPILERLKLVIYAESLGGTESLITYPILQTHASMPKELRDRLGVDEGLMRISVGIEAIPDIIADLGQALDSAKGA